MADNATELQLAGAETTSSRIDRTPPSLPANLDTSTPPNLDTSTPPNLDTRTPANINTKPLLKRLFVGRYKEGYERSLFLHRSGKHGEKRAHYHRFERASNEITLVADRTAVDAIFIETLGHFSELYTHELQNDANSQFVKAEQNDAWIDRIIIHLRSSTSIAYRHIV